MLKFDHIYYKIFLQLLYVMSNLYYYEAIIQNLIHKWARNMILNSFQEAALNSADLSTTATYRTGF